MPRIDYAAFLAFGFLVVAIQPCQAANAGESADASQTLAARDIRQWLVADKVVYVAEGEFLSILDRREPCDLKQADRKRLGLNFAIRRFDDANVEIVRWDRYARKTFEYYALDESFLLHATGQGPAAWACKANLVAGEPREGATSLAIDVCRHGKRVGLKLPIPDLEHVKFSAVQNDTLYLSRFSLDERSMPAPPSFIDVYDIRDERKPALKASLNLVGAAPYIMSIQVHDSVAYAWGEERSPGGGCIHVIAKNADGTLGVVADIGPFESEHGAQFDWYDGKLYVAHDNEVGCYEYRRAGVVDRLWSLDMGGPVGGIQLADGIAYVGSSRGTEVLRVNENGLVKCGWCPPGRKD